MPHALTIKLYYFNLCFEKCFFLNDRPFVFSITDNHFDFVAIAVEFQTKRNSFAKS